MPYAHGLEFAQSIPSVAFGKSRIRIGLVAGEVSGDLLGAGLIRELRRRMAHVSFEGIAGPRMQALGCRALYPMDELSIIGFEVFKKLPRLLRIRRGLAEHFIENPPDLFIGIDAPDFNLVLEERLKAHGVPTVHYVSPTVWAWRGYRIRRIRRAVDHMLALFPFEAKIYRRSGVPVTVVGHPMADEIGRGYGRAAARRRLKLPRVGTLVALMPGSRVGELDRHADLFVETAMWLNRRDSKLRFIAPFVDHRTKAMFVSAMKRQEAQALPLTMVIDKSRDVLAACDIALLASGTAALEAALLRRLMVVTYKVSLFSYIVMRLFAHVDLYSMPNNLAGKNLVPEFIQFDAHAEKIGFAIISQLSQPKRAQTVRAALARIGRSLRRNTNRRAADAIVKILQGKTRRRRSKSR